MTKEELTIAVEKARAETREALQTVFNELNNGQQKKAFEERDYKGLI